MLDSTITRAINTPTTSHQEALITLLTGVLPSYKRVPFPNYRQLSKELSSLFLAGTLPAIVKNSGRGPAYPKQAYLASLPSMEATPSQSIHQFPSSEILSSSLD